jgi:hypothetical protein
MLKLVIKGETAWDEEREEFVYPNEFTIELEHSLISLSKWESVWEKPFLGPGEKTAEETLDYVKQMCLTDDVPPEVFQSLNNDHLKQINDYINAKMSATWFAEKPGQGRVRREIITSEVLYYWMFSAEIPKECEYWHLNRLFTLLKVFNEKNAPPKKMNKQDAAAQRRALNEQRKAQLNTQG